MAVTRLRPGGRPVDAILTATALLVGAIVLSALAAFAVHRNSAPATSRLTVQLSHDLSGTCAGTPISGARVDIDGGGSGTTGPTGTATVRVPSNGVYNLTVSARSQTPLIDDLVAINGDTQVTYRLAAPC